MGEGIDLVPEMKYGEATPSAPTKKDKADGNPEAVLLPQEEQDSEGVTEATQGLRQRKGKNLDSTRVKETVAKTETPEGAHKNAATGERRAEYTGSGTLSHFRHPAGCRWKASGVML